VDSLEIFARSEHPKEQIDALIELVKQRALHKAAKDPTFAVGVKNLIAVAGNTTGADRLIAVAGLCRIGLTVKSWAERMKELMSQALITPLPQLVTLSDPDERLYAASVWRFSKVEWLPAYLGACAVREEGSDRVRGECVQGLVHLSTDLTHALETVRMELAKIWFDTQRPGDSMGRRLKRLLESLRVAVVEESANFGPDAGEALRRLLAESLEKSGRPSKQSVTTEVAEEAVGFMHDLVRTRFSLATEPRTYAALRAVRAWFSEREWEDFVAQSQTVEAVRRDLTEALTMLIRAGVSDNALYEGLVLTAGNTDAAREIAHSIVERFPGITDELRHWLLGTPLVRRSSLAAESQEASLDESIADLLIDTNRLRQLAATIRRDYIGEVDIIAPRLSGPITQLLDLIEVTIGLATLLAKKRGLHTNGNPGDVVEYSPLEHDMGEDFVPGARQVYIRRPAVEALGSTGLRRVIRKALVEPQI
jgi:hypothetical protein